MTRAARKEFHRLRMGARRLKQRLRMPGFDVSPNRRIDVAIGVAAAQAERLDGLDPVAAIMLAIRRVLPPASIARNSIRALRPSKSDDAAYRRGNR